MIPDFKTYIGESVWTDIQKRSSGDDIRREDDVNHMDFDTFADYIKDNYSEKGNWFAVRENEDEKSRHIEIDIIYRGEIDLTFNVVKGELYNILVHGNKNYVDIPGLKDIFNVNVLGSSTFSVYEKNWTISNNTFVKLIEFYLNKKTNESVWTDMQKRSSGEDIRKEDDIDNMDMSDFFNYLCDYYCPTDDNNNDQIIQFPSPAKDNIWKMQIPVEYIATPLGRIQVPPITMNFNTSTRDLEALILSSILVKEYPNISDVFDGKYVFDSSVKGTNNIIPKNGRLTNSMCIDVIDRILGMVKKPLFYHK